MPLRHENPGLPRRSSEYHDRVLHLVCVCGDPKCWCINLIEVDDDRMIEVVSKTLVQPCARCAVGAHCKGPLPLNWQEIFRSQWAFIEASDDRAWTISYPEPR